MGGGEPRETPGAADEEFRSLIARAQAGDESAREAVVRANLRLVWSVVARFRGRGVEDEDLFQIGCLGLLRAVERFDLSLGTRFSTYAVPLIIGEIRRFFRDQGPVKVSRLTREKALHLRRIADRLTAETGREPSLAEVAHAAGISPDEAVEALDVLRPVVSLEEEFPGDEEAETLRDRLADERQGEGGWLEHLALRQALARLSPLERQVILLRFFGDRTQVEVAARLGTNQVRVSRLEKRALMHLRQALEEGSGETR